MRARELKRGALYAVKVSGVVVPVRLEHGYADDGTSAGAGPWTCKNIKTGRRVMVRGAARFRHEVAANQAARTLERLNELEGA